MADERIYVVPLRDSHVVRRNNRAPRAAKLLRAFVGKHAKVGEENVQIENSVNSELWKHGIEKPPRRIRVRVKIDAGKAIVMLADEKRPVQEKGKKEKKKAKKEEKPAKAAEKPIEKKAGREEKREKTAKNKVIA